MEGQWIHDFCRHQTQPKQGPTYCEFCTAKKLLLVEKVILNF
jgi:hypothetical protein